MQRFVSVLSAMVICAFFMGTVFTVSGCKDADKEKKDKEAAAAKAKEADAAKTKVTDKGVAKDLTFTPADASVKQGADVKVTASAKVTKADAPAASKLTTKIGENGMDITVTADAAAPAGDVEITTEPKGMFKVKVTAK